MSTPFPTEGGAHSEEGMPASLTFNSFPLHTHEGVQAAWTFIQDPVNADQYEKDEVETIKGRIRRAAEKHGVEISDE